MDGMMFVLFNPIHIVESVVVSYHIVFTEPYNTW
jgi:hypothetical protein